VERDELADVSQSPEKLSFEVVSKASKYKSRAKSLLGEVQEVVRRSQASLEARGHGAEPEQTQEEPRSAVSANSTTYSYRDFDSRHDRWIYRSSSQCDNFHGKLPALCHSPTESDLDSPASAWDDRYTAAGPLREAVLASPQSPPLVSPWETILPESGGRSTVFKDNGPLYRLQGTRHNRIMCFQPPGQCTACYVLSAKPSLELPSPRHRGMRSESWGSFDSSGPPTPHSTPQSNHPSVNLSTPPAFLNRVDEALKGLDTSIVISELDSITSSPSSSPEPPIAHRHRREPYRTPKRERSYPSYIPSEPFQAPPSLPFRPVPELRRWATQPELRARQRSPILLTKEALEQLGEMTSALKSPVRDRNEHEVDEEYDWSEADNDLFSDDCTVEVASVVVQPYGHSRSNTIDTISLRGSR